MDEINERTIYHLVKETNEMVKKLSNSGDQKADWKHSRLQKTLRAILDIKALIKWPGNEQKILEICSEFD